MLSLMDDNIQAGSDTRYLGKTGLTAAAVFAGAILLPTGFHENHSIPPLTFSYATVSGSRPSYETQPNEPLDYMNPLRALVEYFLESHEVVSSEFASIPRDRFFQIYERF
jgi:hypothetical protein